MVTESSLFEYDENKQILKLKQGQIQNWINSSDCQNGAAEQVKFDFLLVNEYDAEGTESFEVPIEKKVSEEESAQVVEVVDVERESFAGVDLQDSKFDSGVSDDLEEYEKLRVEGITVSNTGLLEIEFNKEIMIPKEFIEEMNQRKETERRLQQSTKTLEEDDVDLKDLLQVSVQPSDIGEVVRDTSVVEYSLEDVTQTMLTFQLTFNDPSDITPVILEPDILLIELTNPDDIIDVQTGEGLEIVQKFQQVDLVR